MPASAPAAGPPAGVRHAAPPRRSGRDPSSRRTIRVARSRNRRRPPRWTCPPPRLSACARASRANGAAGTRDGPGGGRVTFLPTAIRRRRRAAPASSRRWNHGSRRQTGSVARQAKGRNRRGWISCSAPGKRPRRGRRVSIRRGRQRRNTPGARRRRCSRDIPRQRAHPRPRHRLRSLLPIRRQQRSTPGRTEPAPATEQSAGILKSGVVDGMAYTLYSDGSIEAKLAGRHCPVRVDRRTARPYRKAPVGLAGVASGRPRCCSPLRLCAGCSGSNFKARPFIQ